MTPEILYGVGALVLLGGLAYGTTQYNRRNRALDPLRDQKTRELYEREDQAERDHQK
jgi:hypothetical protein